MVKQYSLPELKQIRDNFTNELKEANNGQRNSIAFIKNPLPSQPLVQEGEVYQAISIGGSHLESSMVKKQTGQLLRLTHSSINLPLLTDKYVLFSYIAEVIDPHIKVLGLNFAYPLAPIAREGRLDGTLIKGTKEHKLIDLVGKNVGEELEKYLLEYKKQNIKISVANDTVCVVLSGFFHERKTHITGGIVGTGVNFSLFLDDHTIVNLESGNFDNFPMTDTGMIIDQQSNNPGHQLFEKETSGGYLYHHYNLIRRKDNPDFLPISSSFELTQIASTDGADGSEIAKQLVDRSASLIAAQMAGIFLFKNEPHLIYVMEGSLFWEGWRYKEIVVQRLEELGIPKQAIHIIKVETSNIMGAAGLVS